MVFDAEAAARFLFDDDFGDEEGEEDRDEDLFSLDFLKDTGSPRSRQAHPRGSSYSPQDEKEEETEGDTSHGTRDSEASKGGGLLSSRDEVVLWCVDCSAVPEDLFQPVPMTSHFGWGEGGGQRGQLVSIKEEEENDDEIQHGRRDRDSGRFRSDPDNFSAEEKKTLKMSSPWQEVMKACGSYLKRKIISGDRLIFGLFLAGTGETNNPLGFPNISAALPSVEEIDIHTIRCVNDLAKMDRNAFIAEFGHPVKDHKTEKPALADLFWMISHALGGAVAAHRKGGTSARAMTQRVMFFTADDNPCTGVSREAKSAAIQRLKDMQEDGVDFLLVPLEAQGRPPFEMERFWADALLLDGEGDDKKGGPSAYKRQVRMRMDAINDNIRLVDRTQRVLSVLPLHLRPSLQLPVCILSSVRSQGLPRPYMYLTADEEQQPLRPGTTLAFADLTDSKAVRRGEDLDDEDMLLTGAPPPPSSRGEEKAQGGDEEEQLEKDLLMKLQMLGPSIIGCYTEAGGEKISLSWKDMQAVKAFGPPGLWVLCCKPVSSLARHLNISSPFFVTTTSAAAAASGRQAVAAAQRAARDAGIPEGTAREQEKLFSALIMVLSKKNMAMIVRYVPKNNALVGLAALIPQLEEVDSFGNTLQAPGMHLLRLPFADDIRSFDFPWTSLESFDGMVEERSLFDTEDSRDASGVDDKAMKEEQVRRAMDVLSGLMVDDFHPHQLSNDALQRHFAIIEALALGMSEPDIPPPTLVPDEEVLTRLRPQILEWKKSVYGTDEESFVPATPRLTGTKRTAPANTGRSSSSKKSMKDSSLSQGSPNAAAPIPDTEFKALYQANRVESLTVAKLKAWIISKGEHPHGLKNDLVEQAKQIWNTESTHKK